jgi:hypothetical protein
MKNKLYKQYIYYFCLFIILSVSCTTNLPTTFGRPRQIVLLTNYQKTIENTIANILKQNIYTVQPEPEFLIRYETLDRAENFIKFHLIFIVGAINEEPINTLLQKQQEKIENDSFGLFTFIDPWAKGQYVLIFAVKNHELLETGLLRYSRRIRKTFQDYVLDYMDKITYERGYDKKLTEQLLNKYNFTIKSPFRFTLIDKYETDNFIYLVTHNPDRSIFFYYQQQPRVLDPVELITLRDSLTKNFYDGDYIYKDLTRAETTMFNNIWAIKITGVWQNAKMVIGGPFISYCFNYNNRFYYIDGMLYYPGKKKLDNLNQLNAILHTFKFKE